MRTANGTAPPPAARRRRPIDDDVIESGEIVEKRSLVIRSKVEPQTWNEGPTEVAAPPLEMPKRSWRVLWLAGAILWTVAAVAFALRARPDGPSVDALQAPAAMLATTLDGEARAALVRADAIATSPVLRAAIDTDAGTLADMARDRDVAFTMRAGETIEIFQVRGGSRALLLRLPSNARPLAGPAAGQARLDSAGQQVVVIATAAVANERSKIAGEIVLATPIDLAPVSKQIAEHATGAVLVGLSEPVALVKSSAAPTVTIPVAARTPAPRSLALEASVASGGGSFALAWICMTIAALLLGVFAVTTLRARRA